MVIGFVEAGNMTGTIMNGILRAGIHLAQDMIVLDISERGRSVFRQEGLRAAAFVSEVTKDADIIFLAMRPQNFAEVLEEAKKAVTEQTRFATTAAGISAHYIISTLGCDCPVIRAIPNIPPPVGRSTTALCHSERVPDEGFTSVRSTFEACGTVEVLREDQVSAATLVNNSGPVYVYLLAKATAENADRQGIPVDAALRLFSQTLIDSAEMLLHSGHAPDELAKMAPSPGSITLKALDIFYSRGFEAIIDEAILACTYRAEELGKQAFSGLLIKTIFFTPQ